MGPFIDPICCGRRGQAAVHTRRELGALMCPRLCVTPPAPLAPFLAPIVSPSTVWRHVGLRRPRPPAAAAAIPHRRVPRPPRHAHRRTGGYTPAGTARPPFVWSCGSPAQRPKLRATRSCPRCNRDAARPPCWTVWTAPKEKRRSAACLYCTVYGATVTPRRGAPGLPRRRQGRTGDL